MSDREVFTISMPDPAMRQHVERQTAAFCGDNRSRYFQRLVELDQEGNLIARRSLATAGGADAFVSRTADATDEEGAA